MKKLILLFSLIFACGDERLIRESTTIIKEEEDVILDPVLILNQEVLNCNSEENYCYIERFQENINNLNQINGVIHPELEIINSSDLSLAPIIQFSFENIDYTEIEKIEYKYNKFTSLGEKIAETDYQILNFVDNNFKIPLHVSNFGAGILNSEPTNINQIEILLKNYSNIYYKSYINFYLFSTTLFPLEIYRDENILNSEYYTFQNQDAHTLDAVHIKNNLNSKTTLNFAFEINSTTKAGIKATHRTNTNLNVSYYENIPVYKWSVVEDVSYKNTFATPNYLITAVDDFNNSRQIPYIINNNVILIENFELKEAEHLQLIIQSNFEKLNILGGEEPTTLYTNYSHCSLPINMNFCKCRYSASSNYFEKLLLPPPSGGGTIGGSMWYVAYSILFINLMNSTTIVPDCTNPQDNLILIATDTFKIINELTGRYHKTQNSIFLDVYLKGYENFGSIGSKYLVLPNLEVATGTIVQSTTLLSGYLLNEE